MLTVQEALDAILAHVWSLQAVSVPLLNARGLVLAENIFADIDSPPFDNSAVDGYAVRAADTAAAPVRLRCIGEVPAGTVADRPVEPATCMKVLTGAPMPVGADAMVMVEDTRRSGDKVEILTPAAAGDHLRHAGEDIRRGDRVLSAGALIGPGEIGLLASMGKSELRCIRRPRIAILSTGDELVPIERKPGPGQIRNSNSYALSALVAQAGAKLCASTPPVPDDEAATEAAIQRFMDGDQPADVIVTSGGVSVGDRDFVKPVLERLGTLDLWRVRMKPGKPVAFGRIGPTLFFGLPGNPVSSMVTFELFVRPALWKLAGRTDLGRPRMPVVVTEPVPHHPGREEYVRATVRLRAGQLVAAPTGGQGSGMLSSMVGANALLVLPAERGDAAAGDTLQALLLGLPLPEGAPA